MVECHMAQDNVVKDCKILIYSLKNIVDDFFSVKANSVTFSFVNNSPDLEH